MNILNFLTNKAMVLQKKTQASSSKQTLKSAVVQKITADVEARWMERGHVVDQDFHDDLDDVVSDLIEDRGPGYFKGMEKGDKYTEIIDNVISNLD